MQNNHTSEAFKKLLDKLQTESWQLELLISGFAIFGLWQSMDGLQTEYIRANKLDESLYAFILGGVINAVFVLIIILLIHVVLRGLWIGTLGLRYVSGEIEYPNLNYVKKFEDYLSKRVGSFDRYIARLENVCSTLFALAFLMVFYFISYFLLLGYIGLFQHLFYGLNLFSDHTADVLFGIFIVPYAICLILLFIDFISMGALKRTKWIAIIYFPIYRLFGYIMLSKLYRPLVYNFHDQKKARLISMLVMPIFFGVSIIMASFGNKNSNVQVFGQETSAFNMNKLNYEDELIEDDDFVQFVSIPSKVIDKPYMKVFIGYNDFLENAVFEKDSTLKPKKDKRGYRFHLEKLSQQQGTSVVKANKKTLKKQQDYLSVFNAIYDITIDTLNMEKEFVLTTNTKNRFGFETYIDLKNLKNGKHLLRLEGPDPRTKKEKDTLMTIPFWYFNE